MTKCVFYLALAGLVLSPLAACAAEDDGEAPSAAVTREDKKAAVAWYKEDIANKKKALSLFKKVKDEKSAEKAATAVLKLYGIENEGEKTAMGVAGARVTPEGPAMEAEAKKNDKVLARLIAQLQKEQERISALNIESERLSRAFSAAISE